MEEEYNLYYDNDTGNYQYLNTDGSYTDLIPVNKLGDPKYWTYTDSDGKIYIPRINYDAPTIQQNPNAKQKTIEQQRLLDWQHDHPIQTKLSDYYNKGRDLASNILPGYGVGVATSNYLHGDTDNGNQYLQQSVLPIAMTFTPQLGTEAQLAASTILGTSGISKMVRDGINMDNASQVAMSALPYTSNIYRNIKDWYNSPDPQYSQPYIDYSYTFNGYQSPQISTQPLFTGESIMGHYPTYRHVPANINSRQKAMDFSINIPDNMDPLATTRNAVMEYQAINNFRHLGYDKNLVRNFLINYAKHHNLPFNKVQKAYRNGTMYTTEDKPLIIKSEPKSWADKAAELKLPYREFIAGLPEGEPIMTTAEYNRFMLRKLGEKAEQGYDKAISTGMSDLVDHIVGGNTKTINGQKVNRGSNESMPEDITRQLNSQETKNKISYKKAMFNQAEKKRRKRINENSDPFRDILRDNGFDISTDKPFSYGGILDIAQQYYTPRENYFVN